MALALGDSGDEALGVGWLLNRWVLFLGMMVFVMVSFLITYSIFFPSEAWCSIVTSSCHHRLGWDLVGGRMATCSRVGISRLGGVDLMVFWG